MAFTFNWTGFSTPEIRGGSNDYQRTIREDSSNFGGALRGYEVKKANQEYADILDSKAKIQTISARIAQLEQRNAELRSQLQGMAQNAISVEPEPAAIPDTYIGQVGGVNTPANISGVPIRNAFSAFNPNDPYTTGTGINDGFNNVKYIQSQIGTNPDGVWGRKSRRAWVKNPVFLGDRIGGWEYPPEE